MGFKARQDAKRRVIRLWRFGLVLILVGAAGCLDGKPMPPGNLGDSCYPDGICAFGLTCGTSWTCVQNTDGGVTTADTTGTGVDTDHLSGTGCACSTAGATRCAGEAAQVCANGEWATLRTCGSPDTCIEGRCVEIATGCPSGVTAAYDGNGTIVRVLPPELVSDGCYSGGEDGMDVAYGENTPTSRPRNLTFELMPGVCPTAVQNIDFDSVFGLDIEAPVSSSELSDSFISQHVEPHQVVVFYRHTAEIRRIAMLWSGSRFVGRAMLQDWQYGSDIAGGPSCPPAPNQVFSTPSACAAQ